MSIRKLLKKIVEMPSVILRKVQVSLLSKNAEKNALRNDHDYRSYIREQIKKSYGKMLRANKINSRTTHLVGVLKGSNKTRPQQTILCVGCRNSQELDYIEQTLELKASGLDLFSVDERIVVGDMHKMPFADNSYDHLYSCHSLEHAFDLDTALKEFVRVVRPTGTVTIEMPIKFSPNNTDYWDLGTSNNLRKRIEHNVDEVLLEENARNSGNQAKEVIRLIFSVRK